MTTELYEPINARASTVRIKELILQWGAGELRVPSYQREANVWSPDDQATFIESILCGIPVPAIFMSEKPGIEGCDIVDGLQRITAINKFARGDLRFKGLSLLPQFNGMTYFDLPDEVKIQFRTYGIPVFFVPLESKFGDVGKLLFHRLNMSHQLMAGEWIRFRSGPRFRALRNSIGDLLKRLGTNDRCQHEKWCLYMILGTTLWYRDGNAEIGGHTFNISTGANNGQNDTQAGRANDRSGRYLEEMSEEEFKTYREQFGRVIARCCETWGDAFGVGPFSKNHKRNPLVFMAQVMIAKHCDTTRQISDVWGKMRLRDNWRQSELAPILKEIASYQILTS